MPTLAKMVIAAFAGMIAAVQPQTPSPVSVCELLQNRMKNDRKMVVVRGEEDGTSEGMWLVDDSCKGAIVVGGRNWGNSIALVTPDFALRPVDFRYDREAEERLQREFKRLKVDPKRVRVFATYEGLFETRPDSELSCRNCGFGHLGGSPAQLVIKTQRDLEVKPRQTKR